ncbi:MAG: DUF4430 domain-containing protein, partial [Lachnospiraceae bacterium]|nr:DUF4430 domain-containing protein [Lachnospiraceae bacterium]
MKRRFLGLVLAVIMALGLLPATAFAAAQDPSVPQVHVIVENTTLPAAEGAAWEGTLVDTWVNIDQSTTMMSAVAAALDEVSADYIGADTGYIEEINGLAEFDGGTGSGWMGTLNDWFVNRGFPDWTVADGSLQAGDLIRVMYTRNMGADLGGDYYDQSNTSLAALSVDGATLSPAFSPDNMTYTVYVPAGTAQLTIQATAANKQNNVVYRVGETEYRRTAAVPVENGTDVSVICGGQTEYMLTVSSEEAPWNVIIPAGDGFTVTGASTVAKGADYTFTVAVDEGWDASEMIVTVNGEAVTPDETGVYTVPAVQSDLTIAVSGLIAPPAGPEVTFQGHTAQVAYIQVYTYDNGQIGATDLLADTERSVSSSNVVTYTADLPVGDYWVKGYDDRDQYSGGILVTVTENGENVFNFQRAYSIYASNSGWVQGTDYTVDVSIQGADMSERVIELGSVYPYESSTTAYPSAICLYGDTVNVTYTPSEARAAEGFIAATKSVTMTSSSSSFSQSIPSGIAITVTAPAGSTITMGQQSGYYAYTYFAPEASVTNEDGTITNTYNIPKNTTAFYRVQNPAGVTYYQYTRYTANTDVAVTEEQLYMNSDAVNAHSIFRYDYNNYDRADIYLNINGQGYMDMSAGQTYELNVFRNWMAIESISNNQVALPDTHYTVIDANGQPSDVVTITPNANNPMVANMTANHAGTAIVVVTYDAMTHMTGMTTNTSSPRLFSAVWPECAGVFVVTVGAGQPGISTGMTMNRFDAQTTALDAEHDILFYVGNEGAEYTFAPEAGVTVTVARPTLGANAPTYTGFSADGVTANADGTVTVTGLTSGRNIIKVEKDGAATYQVVTARQVSYELQDADGNALTEAQVAALSAGDTFFVQFHDLVNPAEKMSGAYNFNARVLYVAEDGTQFMTPSLGSYGSYDFSGNPARQRFEVTIPAYWTGDTYSMSGAIRMAGFANVAIGGHRGVTYARGLNPGYDAPAVGMTLAAMPELTFELASTDFLTSTLSFVDGEGQAIDPSAITRVVLTDGSGNTQQMNADGTFMTTAGETYAYVVYAAGYVYKTGSVEVTADGQTFTVELQASSQGAWDGASMTEPAQDENGVYQISNGAELAWFGNQFTTNGTSSALTLAGVLTNDIDLANYPWTPIGTNATAKQFRGSLDGVGHAVTNLNVNTTAQYSGLIAYAGAGAQIRNLTVSGTVTSNAQYAGGIVAYASGSASAPIVFENCISNVNVTLTTNKNYAGGVAGYANGGVQFINCANHGDISANNYVAGVSGYVSGATTFTACYNTSDITGAGYVGGIMSYSGSSAVTMTACYNTGDINATGNNVGGVAGYIKGSSTITDVYST